MIDKEAYRHAASSNYALIARINAERTRLHLHLNNASDAKVSAEAAVTSALQANEPALLADAYYVHLLTELGVDNDKARKLASLTLSAAQETEQPRLIVQAFWGKGLVEETTENIEKAEAAFQRAITTAEAANIETRSVCGISVSRRHDERSTG